MLVYKTTKNITLLLLLNAQICVAFGADTAAPALPELSATEQAELNAELAQIRAESARVLEQIKQDLPKMEAEMKADDRAERLEHSANIKSNNTVLAKLQVANIASMIKGAAHLIRMSEEKRAKFEKTLDRSPFNARIYLTLFRGDIPLLGVMAANFVTDYFFYKKFIEKRMEFVMQQTTDDIDTMLDFLHKIEADPLVEEYLERDLQGGFDNRLKLLFSREPQVIKDFKKYIRSRYQFVGFNPFKSKIAGPTAARFVAGQLSGAIHTRILQERFDPTVLNSYFSYDKKEDGRPQTILPFPFSIINRKVLISPVMMANMTEAPIRSIVTSGMDLAQLFCCNVPKFMYSYWFWALYHMASFYYSTKVFDSLHTDIFMSHILEYRKELITILEELKAKKHEHQKTDIFSNPHETAHERKEKLKPLQKFMDNAHTFATGSPFPLIAAFKKWNTSKHISKDKFASYAILGGIVIPVLWKAVPWVYKEIQKLRQLRAAKETEGT